MGEIIVVNHDPEFLALMHEFLTDEGYTVSTWNNIDNALEHARSIRPDLIIVDLQLERADPAWAQVEALRSDSQLTATPMLVTSTQGSFFHQSRELLEYQGIETLTKPFELSELLDKVQSLIQPTSDENA